MFVKALLLSWSLALARSLSLSRSLALSFTHTHTHTLTHKHRPWPLQTATLLGENRKLRHAVKQHNENLEKATHIIVKMKKEKTQLEESNKKNYVRTKKCVEKLKSDLEEKTKALDVVETEVSTEKSRFIEPSPSPKVDSAIYIPF